MELRVGGKYRLSRKLGGGAFGDVYHGKKSVLTVKEQISKQTKKWQSNL